MFGSHGGRKSAGTGSAGFSFTGLLPRLTRFKGQSIGRFGEGIRCSGRIT